MSKFSIHTTQDTRGNQRSESITDQVAACQHSGPYTEFLPLVPFTQQEQSSGEERGLDETQEETGEKGAHEAAKVSVDGRYAGFREGRTCGSLL